MAIFYLRPIYSSWRRKNKTLRYCNHLCDRSCCCKQQHNFLTCIPRLVKMDCDLVHEAKLDATTQYQFQLRSLVSRSRECSSSCLSSKSRLSSPLSTLFLIFVDSTSWMHVCVSHRSCKTNTFQTQHHSNNAHKVHQPSYPALCHTLVKNSSTLLINMP